jgi:biopolymer transport protein ExbD
MALGSNRNRGGNKMPELNLTPMMDLVLTILCFFIVASISLANSSSNTGTVDIALPSANKNGVSDLAGKQKPVDPLIVGIDGKNELFIESRKITISQIEGEIKAYLAKNPKDGSIILKADSQIPYAKVIEVLGQMRAFGGEKVSLAVNKN